METQNSFQFGVEIEVLLASRKKTHPNWKSLARDLSKRLAKAGIANHVNEGNNKSRENYREWSLVQEITIPSQPAKNLWGIELVSPIYPIHSYWASDLSTIFSVLQSPSGSYTIVPSPNCSTHVHVSSTPVPFSAQDLASLAKCALYYEPALDLLVPAGRRNSTAYWCQSNRANPALHRAELDSLAAGGTGGLGSCLDFLDAITTASSSGGGYPTSYASGHPENQAKEEEEDTNSPGGSSASFSSSSYSPPSSTSSGLQSYDHHHGLQHQSSGIEDSKLLTRVVSAMNLFPHNSAYGRSHNKKKDFLRGKVYKWDFTGMLPALSSSKGDNSSSSGRGTIEFRQPPGSLSADDAAGWITLAVAFIVGSLAVGPRLAGGDGDGQYGMTTVMNGASPEELWELLACGGEALGWESLGAVEGLFARIERE